MCCLVRAASWSVDGACHDEQVDGRACVSFLEGHHTPPAMTVPTCYPVTLRDPVSEFHSTGRTQWAVRLHNVIVVNM